MKVALSKEDLIKTSTHLTQIVDILSKKDTEETKELVRTLGIANIILVDIINDGMELTDTSMFVWKEDKDARGEESTTNDISRSVSGADSEDQGPEDRQEEVATGSTD